MAEDRAEQLKREPDKVVKEIEKRIRDDVQHTGDFSRVHPFPHLAKMSLMIRMYAWLCSHPDSRTHERGESPALTAAKQILESRGNAPRLHRNTLVFLVADKERLQDLDEAVRRYLAWESILPNQMTLDLSPFQVRQAEEQKRSAELTLRARLPETYQWLLVPTHQHSKVDVA